MIRRSCIFLTIVVVVGILMPGGQAAATDATPFTARQGLDLATDAARVWAADAKLTYLENDETVSGAGTSLRWGYLFYSKAKGEARGYTVRGGKILEAKDLEFDFDAPPITSDWIDSAEALLLAEKRAGKSYRRDHGGRLDSMLLIRGAFDEKNPDASTWALVYTSDEDPTLFVVIDAVKGKVVKIWRG